MPNTNVNVGATVAVSTIWSSAMVGTAISLVSAVAASAPVRVKTVWMIVVDAAGLVIKAVPPFVMKKPYVVLFAIAVTGNLIVLPVTLSAVAIPGIAVTPAGKLVVETV